MKISIIGAGNVGTTLGDRLARRHAVRYGVRRTRKAAAPDPARREVPVADACAWADALIVAVPGWRTQEEAAALAGSLGPGAAGAAARAAAKRHAARCGRHAGPLQGHTHARARPHPRAQASSSSTRPTR